jgi:hypothetical protein
MSLRFIIRTQRQRAGSGWLQTASMADSIVMSFFPYAKMSRQAFAFGGGDEVGLVEIQ